MHEIIKVIGGLLIILFFFLFIGLVWFDTHLMLKLLATDGILVGLCLFIDKSSEKK